MVPLDGSKFAESALPLAIDVAGRLDGRIGLVTVAPKRTRKRGRGTLSVSAEELNRADAKRSEYLDSIVQKIQAVSSLQVFCTVLFGTAAKELVKYSTVHHPELIVMSTHGRGQFSRAWIGSVADWVVRHASIPVLLIRPEEGTEPELNTRRDFTKVLVALDGSHEAEQSLRWAKAIGDKDTVYTLVRVARDSLPVWSVDTTTAPFDIRDYTRAGYIEADEYLHKAERLVNNGGQNATCVVLEGVPAAVGILKAASERDVDLIAITTHGRGGLPRLILGSVTDKVVRAAPVPVLVVRPQRT
jgi:nucleotide-binding universal stress UspA family protein